MPDAHRRRKYFQIAVYRLERVQYTACSEVGEQLIRIFAVSFLLYEYGSGDYGRIAMLIFAGMVCSEVFSALFLTRLFRRNMRYIRFTRPDKELYGQFFGIAAPLSASALIGNMLGSAGAVLLPQRLMAAGLDYEQALSALGVISGMAMPLLLFPVAFVSSVCTALLPAVTAAQAVGEQARVRVLTGRAVTTVGLIGIPATAVLVPLAPQLSELFFRQPLTGGYAALLGAAAVAAYYQMATAACSMRSACKGGTWQPPSLRSCASLRCCTAGAQGQRSAFTATCLPCF